MYAVHLQFRPAKTVPRGIGKREFERVYRGKAEGFQSSAGSALAMLWQC